MGRPPTIRPLEVAASRPEVAAARSATTGRPRDALLKESDGGGSERREGAATYSHGSHEEKCG